MATIINRRLAVSIGPAPARGPGARLDALTWLGWASAVAAFGWLVFSLRPLLGLGDISTWNWEEVSNLVLTALRDASVVGMPAALELGVPGARRRTPWLMRGLVLLALEQLSRQAVNVAREYAFTQLAPDADPFAFDTPLSLAFGIAPLALNLLAIGGAWALADGLFDAGSRPRRSILGGVVVAGMAVTAAAYLPLYGLWPGSPAVMEAGRPVFWINLAGIAMGFVEIALWLVVGFRLFSGITFGLRPRRAWALGAVAGAGLLLVRFGAPLLILGGLVADPTAGTALQLTSTGLWVVLFLAFAAGLGRGRERREAPVRIRLFVRNPTS